MITEGLHCRLMAAANTDFDAVRKAAERFGKPIAKPSETPSIIAWNERLSFESGGWSWASGVPTSEVTLRIAVFHFGSLNTVLRRRSTFGVVTEIPANVGVFGIMSGFSSLSNAGRDYISRLTFGSNQVSLYADLDQIITDPALYSELVGYSYIADGVFHAVSDISPGTRHALKDPFPLNVPRTIVSVQFKTSDAVITLNPDADLLISAEPGDPDYAIEDARSIFSLIRQTHLKVRPQV